MRLDSGLQICNLRDHPEAVPRIAKWHFAEWHALYPQKALADFERDLHESLGDAAIPQTWLLIDSDELCGTASVLVHDMTINKNLSPWLANIFIRKEKRGSGLGKTLVLNVMDEIRRLGVPEIYLFTEDQQAFYEKLNWTWLKTEDYE